MSDYQGKKFEQFLKKHGISAAEAALILGVSRTQVYSYFKSESLKRETVNMILAKFNIKPGELFRTEERTNEDMQSRLINALEDQILLLKNSLLDKDKIIEGLEARLKDAEDRINELKLSSGHGTKKAG